MELTPELVLWGYSRGLFPMAESRTGPIHWYEPVLRGILPLDRLKVSRSLSRVLRSGRFRCTYNTAFRDVVTACADRETTWISTEILDVYSDLHARGFAHSVEVWLDSDLVGGLYGVGINSAFFGESMFHRVSDASKVALVHLVERLRRHGFSLLDMQYLTPHLETLGGIEISQSVYLDLLRAALIRPAQFCSPVDPSGILSLGRPDGNSETS
jgi:leucyl/phenylalanyl-tRNA--protein transferase